MELRARTTFTLSTALRALSTAFTPVAGPAVCTHTYSLDACGRLQWGMSLPSSEWSRRSQQLVRAFAASLARNVQVHNLYSKCFESLVCGPEPNLAAVARPICTASVTAQVLVLN